MRGGVEMRYKTTIEVSTDADNRYEAADIAGEFLRGDISSGAEVKVRTESFAQQRALKMAIVVCAIVTIGGMCMAGNQIALKMARVENKQPTSYAIQPPLGTNLSESEGADFKVLWLKERADRINAKVR